MSIQTGYEDKPLSEIPPPEEVKWTVQLDRVAEGSDEHFVYARVEIDGEAIGMLRLPSAEYLRWIRERIQDGT